MRIKYFIPIYITALILTAWLWSLLPENLPYIFMYRNRMEDKGDRNITAVEEIAWLITIPATIMLMLILPEKMRIIAIASIPLVYYFIKVMLMSAIM